MSFHYKPLNPLLRQIRLLTLLSSSDGEINVRLDIVSLEDRPVFDALSYVWGEEDDPDPIRVNGKSFMVRKNLKAGLRQLQNSETQALWIDAICIDQKSVEEKNHQLPFMRNMYTRASRVIIWLGEGDRYISKLFQWLQDQQATKSTSYATCSTNLRAIFDTETYIGYYAAFLLPYWQRIWTFQELTLAENDPLCVYGKYWSTLTMFTSVGLDEHNIFAATCDEENLKAELANLDPSIYGVWDNVSMFHSKYRDKTIDIWHGTSLARELMRDDRFNNLFLSLAFTIGRKSSDALDRFYALYGMDDSIQSVFPADYRQSNTPEKVMVETATWMLEEGEGSVLFNLFGLHPSRFSDNSLLPSWTPNFDSRCRIFSFSMDMAESLRQRSAQEFKPATHDRDVAVLLGMPGVGVLTAGQPEREAIPASFKHFRKNLSPWALEWLKKQGFDVSMVVPKSPNSWEVVRLPAYHEPKTIQVAEQSRHKALLSKPRISSCQHLARHFLGDIPSLRMTARNLGRCVLTHQFGLDEIADSQYIGDLLWYPRRYSSWNLMIEFIDGMRESGWGHPDNFWDPVVDKVQTAAMGYKPRYEVLLDRNVSVSGIPEKAETKEERLGKSLALFIKRSAIAMSGMNAFTVDLHGDLRLGFTGEPIETGDIVIVPLGPYNRPLVLRREEPHAFNCAPNSAEHTEEPLHGTWTDLDWYRMVGAAFMKDLVEETQLVAKVAKQNVADFYVR